MTAKTASIRLSAVIPNFNHGRLIGKAISALAQQSPNADEIIVVDDGSTDNSIEILEGLRQEYPTLRIVSLKKNQGAIFALNRCLQEARGKYIYFGAADDLTLPGLFAATLAVLDQYPQAAFASCEAIVSDTDTGQTAYRPPVRPSYSSAFLDPPEVTRLLRHIDNWILTGAAVVRRDFISDAGGFDATLGSFADSFVLRRLSLQYGCCYVPQTGLVWKVSSKGLSRTHAADVSASMQTLATALERMRADPVFPLWYPAVFERRWRFAISKLAVDAEPMNLAVLTRVSGGPIGRAFLTGACALGGLPGRIAALVWLSLLERPTSFTGLLKTWLSRSRLATNWKRS